MTINYIVVSYPGKTKSRMNDPYSEEILDIHMKYLHRMLVNKQKLGIRNLIEQVTLVYTEPKPEDYQNYYNVPKWQKMFEGLTQFVVLDYVGKNKHYSYDKFLLAIEYYKEIPYNILIEDDYFIDLSNPHFDIELLTKYRRSFPENFGYLCTHAPKNDKGQKTVASIANGFLSTFSVVSRRLEKDGTTPKTQLERLYSATDFCQVAFGNIFMPYLDDLSDEYYLPFWTGVDGELQDFTEVKSVVPVDLKNMVKPKKMFMPIQLCDEIRNQVIPVSKQKVERIMQSITDLYKELKRASDALRGNEEFLKNYSTDPQLEEPKNYPKIF